MITRIEIITELCELQAEADELKRMSTELNARLQRLLLNIQEEVSQE